MKYYNILAKKRLATEKTEFFLLVVTIVIVTAVLLMSLTLSVNYFVFLVKNSEGIIGESFVQLLKNNLKNLSEIEEYLSYFFAYFNSGSKAAPPEAKFSRYVFSPTASIENLPSTIILLLVVVLTMVNTVLSIVFKLCKKSRRGFLITMLASGDTIQGIKKYVWKETQYILFISVPLGAFLGVVGVYTVRFIGKMFFENHNFSQFPVNINISLTVLVITMLIISLLTFKFSKRTYKNISITQVASELKTKLTADNGIRTMTAAPNKYLRKGMEHFVSIGNFSSNVMNYMGMLGTTSITLLVFMIIVLMFDIIRNYNGQELLSHGSQIVEFSVAAEIYFISVTVSLVAISVLAMFISVFANITSNTGIYALMRSSGSNIGSVLRTIRKEGGMTALTCCMFVLVVSVYVVIMTVMIFVSDERVVLGAPWKLYAVAMAAIMLIIVSVFITADFMRKKMKKIDMISTLKNLFY